MSCSNDSLPAATIRDSYWRLCKVGRKRSSASKTVKDVFQDSLESGQLHEGSISETNSSDNDCRRSLPFIFTGGLGMTLTSVGIASTMLGAIGLMLQMALSPPVHRRLGTINCYRQFYLLFAMAAAFVPYLASINTPSDGVGVQVWFFIALLLSKLVTGRTFALPAGAVLLNDCAMHPSSLSAVHSIGQTVSSGFKALGPTVGGYWYGLGLKYGVVGIGWWTLSFIVVLRGLASRRMVPR
jgi:hypothetical protein